ncbi:hypothetical protein Mag101_07090 [Microbulbifer agarilyticus]|uniref:Uncharacterized protein n=1 Tax=Microbulbifer agarilyticus TaxID=260552 RepID=A0A1Q2M575_9GAMM|nr:DUF2905 family protein [Microbulbifer agarilyticus]AQQ67427.1 hypothetical protein Mag101_07090 [Microbulbifer agarilyticus]
MQEKREWGRAVEFILYSLVASVVLTLLVNLIPLVFPDAASKAQKKIEENARRAIEQHEDPERPRVKVFFPWKAMILASILLTILVNLIAYLTRG